jgi:hypothetical protein
VVTLEDLCGTGEIQASIRQRLASFVWIELNGSQFIVPPENPNFQVVQVRKLTDRCGAG